MDATRACRMIFHAANENSIQNFIPMDTPSLKPTPNPLLRANKIILCTEFRMITNYIIFHPFL